MAASIKPIGLRNSLNLIYLVEFPINEDEFSLKLDNSFISPIINHGGHQYYGKSIFVSREIFEDNGTDNHK